MRDAEEWAREWAGWASTEFCAEIAALITAARREGAEDMRERAAQRIEGRMVVQWLTTTDREEAKWLGDLAGIVRAMPLPGDE